VNSSNKNLKWSNKLRKSTLKDWNYQFNECHKNFSKCVLFCKKNNYHKDRNSCLLSDFYDEFINYTVQKIFKRTELLENILTEEDVKFYLKSNKFNNEGYNDILKKIILQLNSIHFPKRDARDCFDYLKILNLFDGIHFNYCKFYLSSLKLNNIKCFFQDCKFYDRWTLFNYDLLENVDNVIYQTCEFNKTVSNYTPEKLNELALYEYSQFDYTCTFKNSVEFNRVKFEELLFNTNQNNYIDKNKIELLKFENCIFEKKLKLNNYYIDEYICIDSLFKDKFEFKENIIINFLIDNSNFKKLIDLFGCKFKIFKIHKSIFNDFVGFENCIFGTKKNSKKEIAIFKYATFTDFLNFRNAEFLSGLDIGNINLKEAPNFLNIKIKIKNTKRETFRVIKNSFDNSGNIIEANKFYKKEMQKREKELEKDFQKNYFEWMVFKIHRFSSEHSQNPKLPLFWIFTISYIYSYLFTFTEKGQLNFHELIYRVNIAYLLYQFVISIRQNTRRK